MEPYQRAWYELKFDRQWAPIMHIYSVAGNIQGTTEMAPMPLSFEAIDRYARRHLIEGEAFMVLRSLVMAQDDQFRESYAKDQEERQTKELAERER